MLSNLTPVGKRAPHLAEAVRRRESPDTGRGASTGRARLFVDVTGSHTRRPSHQVLASLEACQSAGSAPSPGATWPAARRRTPRPRWHCVRPSTLREPGSAAPPVGQRLHAGHRHAWPPLAIFVDGCFWHGARSMVGRPRSPVRTRVVGGEIVATACVTNARPPLLHRSAGLSSASGSATSSGQPEAVAKRILAETANPKPRQYQGSARLTSRNRFFKSLYIPCIKCFPSLDLSPPSMPVIDHPNAALALLERPKSSRGMAARGQRP